MLLPVSRLFRLCLCLCALRGAIPVPRPDIWLHKARTYRARWFGTGAVARKHCMRLPQPPNSLYIMEAYGVCVCVDAVILYMPLLLLLWVVRTAALFVKLWWIFYTFMKIYEHWTCKIHHFGGKSGSGKANALLVLFMSILDPNTTHPTLECYVHFSHESRIQKLLYMMICDVHRARRCCTPPPRLNWAGVFILRYFCSSRFRFSRNSFFSFLVMVRVKSFRCMRSCWIIFIRRAGVEGREETIRASVSCSPPESTIISHFTNCRQCLSSNVFVLFNWKKWTHIKHIYEVLFSLSCYVCI